MEVTYQELLAELYSGNRNPKYNDYNIKEALLGSHEICLEKFKNKYWGNDQSI
ncbi:hypothetical protein [Kordia sp.]|uniref:hypothetical protein n=1 Tax=Kordia sp. TaxID=1965332 RepID=UPI003D26BBAE